MWQNYIQFGAEIDTRQTAKHTFYSYLICIAGFLEGDTPLDSTSGPEKYKTVAYCISLYQKTKILKMEIWNDIPYCFINPINPINPTVLLF